MVEIQDFDFYALSFFTSSCLLLVRREGKGREFSRRHTSDSIYRVWPLNDAGVKDTDPFEVENSCITFDSSET